MPSDPLCQTQRLAERLQGTPTATASPSSAEGCRQLKASAFSKVLPEHARAGLCRLIEVEDPMKQVQLNALDITVLDRRIMTPAKLATLGLNVSKL